MLNHVTPWVRIENSSSKDPRNSGTLIDWWDWCHGTWDQQVVWWSFKRTLLVGQFMRDPCFSCESCGIFFCCFCWQVRSKAEAETLMRKIMRHQLRHGGPAERFRLFTSDAFGFYSSKMPSCCFLQGSQWRSKRAQVGKQRNVRQNFIDGKGHDQWCLANIPAVCRGCFIHSSRCIIKLYIYTSSDNLMHQIPQCHISYENLVWIAWAVLRAESWPDHQLRENQYVVLYLHWKNTA